MRHVVRAICCNIYAVATAAIYTTTVIAAQCPQLQPAGNIRCARCAPCADVQAAFEPPWLLETRKAAEPHYIYI